MTIDRYISSKYIYIFDCMECSLVSRWISIGRLVRVRSGWDADASVGKEMLD